MTDLTDIFLSFNMAKFVVTVFLNCKICNWINMDLVVSATIWYYINEFITQKLDWNIPRHFDHVTQSFTMVVLVTWPEGFLTGVGEEWGWSRGLSLGWGQGTSCECRWLLGSFAGTTFPHSPGSWCHPVCSDDQWKMCVPRWQSWDVFHLCVLEIWCPALWLSHQCIPCHIHYT